MQSLTVYIATACLGAMLFFSFVLAPLIFGRLPAQQAGTFAAGVAGNYFRPDGLPTSSLVLAEFVPTGLTDVSFAARFDVILGGVSG